MSRSKHGLLRVVVAGLAAVAVLTGPATASATPATGTRQETAAKPTTILHLRIAHCDGCTVAGTSVMRADYTDVWTSVPRKVVDGQVRLEVPKDRSRGLSLTLDAPWEGNTGYVTVVALRYQGRAIGESVSLAEARSARRASGCWAGTTDDKVAMTIGVRQVQVQGNGGKTHGTIAWARVTQDYLYPMQRAGHGVLGTQDLFGCGPG